MVHHLKTWPKYFKQITSGRKMFEIRKNDRGFKEGDYLVLEEYDPETKKYTGHEKTVLVGIIIQGEFGLPSDTCVMSVS